MFARQVLKTQQTVRELMLWGSK